MFNNGGNKFMTKYEIIFEALQERVNSGELTLEEAETLNDLSYIKTTLNTKKNIKEKVKLIEDLYKRKKISPAVAKRLHTSVFIQHRNETKSDPNEIFSYLIKNAEFTEAESDYPQHMRLKYDAAHQLKKEPHELKNKKYRTVEGGKKADLQYEYRYGEQKNKRTKSSYDARHNATSYNTTGDVKESDIKKLEYLQKHSDLSNPEEAKKYKAVFNMFCSKYGIDPNSSLYIRYDPANFGNRIDMAEWPQSKKITKKELQPPKKKSIFKEKEQKYLLPKGYVLIHRSSVDNLTELKPRKYSDHYLQKGSTGVGGQFHPTGRIYLVLAKDKNLETNGMGRGKYLYKVTSNISGFYLDYEGMPNHSADRYPDISTLVGKPVYVKSDVPIKVQQIKGNFDKAGRYKEENKEWNKK